MVWRRSVVVENRIPASDLQLLQRTFENVCACLGGRRCLGVISRLLLRALFAVIRVFKRLNWHLSFDGPGGDHVEETHGPRPYKGREVLIDTRQ